MEEESQDNSSNKGSSADGIKLLKSMTSLLTSLQKNVVTLGSNMEKILKIQKEDRKDFVEHVKILNELDKTLKKNTYETHGSMRRTAAERLKYADSIARKFQAEENVKAGAEKELTRIIQGGGRSGGDRGGRRSIGGRGGRPGSDQGGRSSGGNRGGRSDGAARGGRALSPFRNLLIGQEMMGEGMSYEGTRFPIDPRVKMEEQ
ncbi:keratin, type I cytoskeletal 10-like [Impatiens glandulifera]|uniref:keratin, type I cytoskeletal 10-like n=1 Tax=Impatiens glandulifera TaxID=253017 RepID=UPI001FB134F5|nr:keratin, type I cytoskeletal 10-like [Impatiens glandulifera]